MAEKPTYEELEQKIKQFEIAEAEQKQVVRRLLQSESLLNATQQLTKVGGWEWDVEKQTMFWTDEVYRIHEIQLNKITPGSMKHIEQGIECYDPEDRLLIMAAFRLCLEKGQAYDLEFPFTTTMGCRIWVRTVAKPVLNGGKVVKIIGNIMDITERKRIEEALRESEEFSTSLLEHSQNPIVVKNADTSIRYVNPAFEELTGFSSKEILGEHAPFPWWIDDPRSGTIDQRNKDIDKSLKGMEYLFCKKNGETFWAELANTSIRDNGNLKYSLSIWMDITDRKQAEKEREGLIDELQDALENVKALSGLLPICASCKKIRDDKGYWTQIEAYIRDRSEAEFSHGICPECTKKLYPEL